MPPSWRLPSVILILLFGQTRIFFVMSRDGLLPEGLSKVHPKWKTPYVVTAITGVGVAFAAALLPVGQLADIANAGTLYAFFMVGIAVMLLRKARSRQAAQVPRSGALAGRAADHGRLPLPVLLPADRRRCWCCRSGRRSASSSTSAIPTGRSHLGRGLVEVHETEVDDIAPHIPGVDDPRGA